MKTHSSRCLMFYPWNLSDRTGSLALFLSYSRALKSAGYSLDCYAPKRAACDGLFDNIFVAPDSDSPAVSQLEAAGSLLEDPLLPDQLGRDEASMAAAAVLASISDYDVIGIHYTRCHSLKHLLPPGIPTVMFTHDLDSLVARQEEMIFGTPADYGLADEASRLQPFNLVTVVGPDDRRALQTVERSLPLVEAPFTCKVEEGVTTRESTDGVLLWISSASQAHRFSFFWFWKNVWPRIRSSYPKCSLTIGGRICETARQLGAAADGQVSLLGIVDNADELYRKADVLIAPYYFGFGIKTKVIEALAKGIPVATTRLGIYNTRIQPGREALVADDAAEYAAHVMSLISSPGLRASVALSGREYVRKWHDPVCALAPMVEAFENVRQTKKVSSKSRAGALRHLEGRLSHRLSPVIEHCRRDHINAVAIYGAGSHTHILIPIWQSLGGPKIIKIIESDVPSKTTCEGFPVVSAQSFDPSEVGAIVLSSYGYEQAMDAVCSERWPDLKTYPIWESVPFLEHFEQACAESIPSSLYEFV